MEDMVDALYEDCQPDKEEADYPDCPFLREHSPRVADFVRFDRWRGKPRINGQITFRGEEEHYVLTLTDRDNERSFSLVCLDLRQGLETLDQLIASKQVYWRKWGNPTQNGKARRTGTKK